jgi:hypothetical protein
MQKINPSLSLLLILILSLIGCQDRVVDKLRPETVQFLTNQETARCTCLDMYGDEFYKKTNAGVSYIKGLSAKYNLDSLKVSEVYAIKLELVRAMTIIKTVSECIAQKTPQMDQFLGMMVQYDLKEVLGIDSTMSQQEQYELMNIPNLQILDDLCPQHKKSVQKLHEMITAAQILPPGLQ